MTIVEQVLVGASPLVKDSSRLAFISHSHVDKDIAHDLKALLRPLGLNGFVAHDDIEPNAEWQQEILRNLRDCKGLIVVATDAARASPWVNQEIGAAVVRGIGTATLNCGVAPFGFLYHFQAAKWTPKEPEGTQFRDRNFLEANLPEICHALQKAGVVTQDYLIEGMGSAWGFEETRVVTKLIAESGTLEERQALRLAYLADNSTTVRDCWEAQRLLPPLIKPHIGTVPPEIVKRLSDHKFKF
ncbi:MAG TPA: toll/interleukin-1 receptor domain-containing protein [Thermoplasmata archaeon]|nr:toll/interleukin-1 receptor domain-containing protein [Thermoplasmata archaeon]